MGAKLKPKTHLQNTSFDILKHIHKKTFSVFLSRFVRVWLQSLQKVLIRAKQLFSFRNSKNAEFHADFESVEKVLKKCTKRKL